MSSRVDGVGAAGVSTAGGSTKVAGSGVESAVSPSEQSVAQATREVASAVAASDRPVAAATREPGEGDQGDRHADDPWVLIAAWLPPNDHPDRPRMTLSTVTAEGNADARTVLLSGWDEQGFRFNTSASSRKVEQIAGHRGVALTVLWEGFSRQLVIAGRAEVQSDDELAAAFVRRTPFLQQLAHQNTVDFAQLPLAQRRQQFAELAAAHPDGFPQPPDWTGYLVRPTRLTFWVTGVDTASRRTEFTLVDGIWSRTLLPG